MQRNAPFPHVLLFRPVAALVENPVVNLRLLPHEAVVLPAAPTEKRTKRRSLSVGKLETKTRKISPTALLPGAKSRIRLESCDARFSKVLFCLSQNPGIITFHRDVFLIPPIRCRGETGAGRCDLRGDHEQRAPAVLAQRTRLSWYGAILFLLPFLLLLRLCITAYY